MTEQRGQSSWAAQALVYGAAPVDASCCRCDLPLPPSGSAVSVPGLQDRAWAHPGCLPPPGVWTTSSSIKPNVEPLASRTSDPAAALHGPPEAGRALSRRLRTRRAGAGRVLVVDASGQLVADVERLERRCWRVAFTGLTHSTAQFPTRREALDWLNEVTFSTAAETRARR